MATESSEGPSWLGIGTQRSGTTWLTDLLVQHPQVAVGRSGLKESHFLYRGLLPRYKHWVVDPSPDVKRLAAGVVRRVHARALPQRRGRPGSNSTSAYLDDHSDPRLMRGEWTPAYMPCVWAAPRVRELLPEDAPIFVVLRDPVERFASAMRIEASRSTVHSPVLAERLLGGYAIWCGMYLEQLEAWSRVIGRERMLVDQYERIRKSPQAWVDKAWAAMGLNAVPLTNTAEASRTSRPTGWTWPSGLKSQLVDIYEGQRADLERLWNIDTSLWAQ